MFDIVKLFFDICLFKKGPQDIPPSFALLQMVTGVYVLVAFLVLYVGSGWFDAVLQVLAELIMLIVFTKVLLSLNHKSERYVQTICALFGTDALLSFFALPGITSMTTGRVTLLAFALMIGVMIWHWLVLGYIIRHAISQSFAFGLGIAFLYILASYQVMALLFPEAAGT